MEIEKLKKELTRMVERIPVKARHKYIYFALPCNFQKHKPQLKEDFEGYKLEFFPVSLIGKDCMHLACTSFASNINFKDWLIDRIQELMIKNIEDHYWNIFESGNENSNFDGISNLLDDGI